MKTIAQQLNVKKFPFIIKNNNGNVIYREDSNNYWYKSEFDSNGNEIYYENSKNFWWKREYDSNGKEIYYENSEGVIRDKRPKAIELTMEDIAEKFGVDVKDLKIKK